jgi:translation initiation factor 2D
VKYCKLSRAVPYLKVAKFGKQSLHVGMFKRQPNLKNYSALKSSDRRRFQSDVFDSYPAIKNFHSAENAPPFQAGDLQKAKFATHVDDLGILYSMDNTPAWFEVNDSKPIPTGWLQC